LKRYAASSNKTIEVFSQPEVCSILNNDPAFHAERDGDFGQARSKGARSPLAILAHALTGNLLELPFANIGRGTVSLQQNGATPLIGIAWASVSGGDPIPGKSIPLEKFISVFEDVDSELVSFQRKLDYRDNERLRDQFSGRFSALSDSKLDATDQTDVMREVQKLDCMVTISTTTAHIAASVGIPVVLLAARRPYQQWFWRAQQEHGKQFYPSVQVVLGSSAEKTWWSECLEPAKQALLAEIGG
jgi:ADP-heptose:LPS heptosyltransferase